MTGRINTVELHDLTLGYGKRRLLEHINLGFGWGEFTALIGRNGAGKSTLLRAIVGLERPIGGYITLDGRRMERLSRAEIASHVSFVSTEHIRIAGLRVADLVALGRAPYTGWLGRMSSDDTKAVSKALELVGMSDFTDKRLDNLSDGERQRIMLARALAQDTPVILLDEPTAFLDVPNKYEICRLLQQLSHNEGKCIVFSTHDLDIALKTCDTVALIADSTAYYGTTDTLSETGIIRRLFGDL
jgi:iron complex transport system ATP-binding protein